MVEIKEKVVFYFPWKELSGGPFYLTKLADSLAEKNGYEVYYTDYKNGLSDDMLKNPKVKKIAYNEKSFTMPFNEPVTLITPVYWAHKVPKLHPKSKIVFLNWHYCCTPTLKSTAGWSKYKLNKFLKLVNKTNSCFFLDYSHLIGQNTKKIKFSEIIVPITLKEKNIIARKDIVDNTTINIGVLGRIDGDKVNSIFNIIDNLIDLNLEKEINIHIIGDGVHRKFFEEECFKFGYLPKNIKVIMHGIMVKDELNNFIANNIDILFAMGTSAIEGAAIHLPTVIIPSNCERFYNNDYVWFHNSKKYCLGWYSTQISDMEINTQTISEILNDIYIKGNKEKYGNLDYEYYLKNHTSNIDNFIYALNKSTLKYEKLKNMLKSIDTEDILSIRNVDDKKVIKILGIKISLKRKDYILRQDIQNLHRRVDGALIQDIQNLHRKIDGALIQDIQDLHRKIDNTNNMLNNDIKQNILHSLCYQTNLYNKVNVTHGKVFPKYKNLHNGQTAVLIASGPTVNDFSPEFIKDENVKYIAVNGSFAYDKVNFDYLFLQDYSGLKDSVAKIPFAKNLKTAKKFYGVMSPVPPNMIIPESIILRDNAEKYYVHSVCYDNGKLLPMVDYATDLSSEFFMCHGTIPLIAMQFLLYSGFKKIYLVGCDCSTKGHFSNEMEKQVTQATELDVWLLGWKKLREFARIHYPDTEIISVNPVGLKGIFNDVYIKSLSEQLHL